MISEPRTIARIVDLYHIPLTHSVEQLRDVYLKVSGSCGYDNFMRQAGGARLEAATEGSTVSRVTFSKDRITFVEEHAKSSVESFRRRAEEVISVAAENLNIPIFVARNITVRMVATAPGGTPASQFLAANLVNINADEVQALGRPTQIMGVRLNFPPPDVKGGSHQVRIESYVRDQRSLYIEDVATFKVPVQSRDPKKIRQELQEVEDFLHNNVRQFLSQYPRS